MTVCAVSKPNEKTPAPSEGTGAPRRGETLPLPRTRTVLRGASERLGRYSGRPGAELRPGAQNTGAFPRNVRSGCAGRAALTAAGPRGNLTRFPILPRSLAARGHPTIFFPILLYQKGLCQCVWEKQEIFFDFFHVKRITYKMHKKYTKFFLKSKKFVTRSSQIYATI